MRKNLLLLGLILLITLTIGSSLAVINAYTAWAVGVAYHVGDYVTYSGSDYRCLQAHTSQSDWTPPAAPSLWQLVGSGGGSTPTASKTPTATKTPSGSTPAKTPTATKTPSGSGGGSWGSKFFAPYVDVMLWPTFSINTCYTKTTQKYYTLAFITANGTNPAWGGITPLSDNFYAGEINSIRGVGGDVIISFGGANGTELALAITNVSSLQAAYQSVINQYRLTWVDYDIEGYAVAEPASIDRRNKAIKGLQSANPSMGVAFCLPVMPTGLTQDGLNVLSNAKSNGVRIDVVNVMAMDYGGSYDMGQAAIDAANNTHNQCNSLGISCKIGITPMIGRNDVSVEVFDLSDASQLLSFAQGTSCVRALAMWSSTRDNGSCGAQAYASPSCSSIVQSEFAFTNIFKAYK
jgi:hypothetical protein